MKWVRLWSDMPADAKWRVAAKRSKRPISEVIAVFTMMMIEGGKNGDGCIKGLRNDVIAETLEIPVTAVTALRNALRGLVTANGFLTGWDERQPNGIDRTNAERQRRFRAKKHGDGVTPLRPLRQPLRNTRSDQIRSDQIREEDSSRVSEDQVEKGIAAYNDLAHKVGLSTAKITKERRRLLAEAIASGQWEACLKAVEETPFLLGNTGGKWKATFPWLVENCAKVLSGEYRPFTSGADATETEIRDQLNKLRAAK